MVKGTSGSSLNYFISVRSAWNIYLHFELGGQICVFSCIHRRPGIISELSSYLLITFFVCVFALVYWCYLSWCRKCESSFVSRRLSHLCFHILWWIKKLLLVYTEWLTEAHPTSNIQEVRKWVWGHTTTSTSHRSYFVKKLFQKRLFMWNIGDTGHSCRPDGDRMLWKRKHRLWFRERRLQWEIIQSFVTTDRTTWPDEDMKDAHTHTQNTFHFFLNSFFCSACITVFTGHLCRLKSAGNSFFSPGYRVLQTLQWLFKQNSLLSVSSRYTQATSALNTMDALVTSLSKCEVWMRLSRVGNVRTTHLTC